MNTQLSLDTCNNLCAAALSHMDNGAFRLISSDTRDLGRGHAEVLTDQIQQVLSEADLKPADLSRIAVTTGPGSFTGQRVGLATARTLAASLNIEAVGVGVLDALIHEARSLAPDLKAYCAISDAKRGGVYIKAAAADGEVLLEASLIAVSDIPDRLSILDTTFAIAGTGVAFVDDNMDLPRHKNLSISFPSIQSIAKIGHSLIASENPAAALYLRDADAKPQNAKHVLRAMPSSGSEVAV